MPDDLMFGDVIVIVGRDDSSFIKTESLVRLETDKFVFFRNDDFIRFENEEFSFFIGNPRGPNDPPPDGSGRDGPDVASETADEIEQLFQVEDFGLL